MSDREIDSALYERAVQEIAADLERKSSGSAATREFREKLQQGSAKNLFADSWHSAHDAHDRHVHAMESRQPNDDRLADDPRLARLSPELREEVEASLAHSRDFIARERARITEKFEESHRGNLIGFFTVAGVSQTTAVEIVDLYVIKAESRG